jgi:hypothetical protein
LLSLVTDFADDHALLLFGGSISASVNSGQFSGNTAGTAMVTLQEAALQKAEVHRTAVTEHCGEPPWV